MSKTMCSVLFCATKSYLWKAFFVLVKDCCVIVRGEGHQTRGGGKDIGELSEKGGRQRERNGQTKGMQMRVLLLVQAEIDLDCSTLSPAAMRGGGAGVQKGNKYMQRRRAGASQK
jgi:hypothetical protein